MQNHVTVVYRKHHPLANCRNVLKVDGKIRFRGMYLHQVLVWQRSGGTCGLRDEELLVITKKRELDIEPLWAE